jgi:nitrite reductase/ring-hydroxylating ferredoxin subunit
MWVRVFTNTQQIRIVLKPDRPQLVIFGETRIALILHNETVFAVQDFCTHNKESLSKGSVNYLGEIVCPWHGQRFNLKTGRECGQRSADLKAYAVKVNEEGLFIKIEE